jgi:predicted ATPase/class 3 adenylate cyclase
VASLRPPSVVTFLFTDIEGSTRLWGQEPERMHAASARHDTLARTVVQINNGIVVKMTGDGVHAAFEDPLDAVGAALQLQQALADPEATSGIALRVRCGLHVGVVERRDNDFFGSPVNRAARIMGAAHGGQVLLSQAVATLIGDRLPAGVALRDLGSVRLRDLASPEHVFQVAHPQLRQDFPALRSLEATPNNLPQQVTSFVGRECVLDEVKQWLAKSRLVTLLGAGGLGKTRLSLQVAADVLDDYPDGVWLVELAPQSDACLVPQAVASVLGIKEETGRPVAETLVKYVKDRELLLILDNCEHLVQACAELTKQLLQSGPRVRVLATSREPLHVAGESTYPVPALSVPDMHTTNTLEALTHCEAARLFIDRALAAKPAFRVTDQNAGAVAALCHRLDGIPLALELAAARVRTLSVEKIAERLTDRFRLLTGGDHTAMPRQQTLRACTDWSYDLLAESERALLRQLAVFAGGWTIEAAEAVGAGADIDTLGVLDLLTRLVEKSLVALDAKGERYGLLETVREYARERLLESGEEAGVRRRHAEYCLALAEEAEPFTRGGAKQKRWLDLLEVEHDNLRTALTWALERPESEALGPKVCAALWRFWCYRCHWREGRRWCLEALERVPGESNKAMRARLLMGAGTIGGYLGEPDARILLENALALSHESGDRDVKAATLNTLAKFLIDRNEIVQAQPLLEQARQINRELGNGVWEAMNLTNLAEIFRQRGEYAKATATAEEALALSRRCGDRWLEAYSLALLGGLARACGDYAAAEALREQALASLRELGFALEEAEQLMALAELAFVRGDSHAAGGYLIRALEVHRKLESPQYLPWCFDVTAALAVESQAYTKAARLWGAAYAAREGFSGWAEPFDIAFIAPYRARCREALGAQAFATAEAGGRVLSPESARGEALAWLIADVEASAGESAGN